MPKILKNILIATFIVTMVTCYSVAHPAADTAEILQNTPEVPVINSNVVHAQEVVYDDPVEQYIRLKFGVYADKAMMLLTDPRCHENINLDPKAVNDNRTWGGKGRDRGVFQISDYYHPGVTDQCAFDFKCNIDYAYRMFVNDGYTFSKRWTCGKYLKSLGIDI